MTSPAATAIAAFDDDGANTAAEFRTAADAALARMGQYGTLPSHTDGVYWDGTDVAAGTLVEPTGGSTVNEVNGTVTATVDTSISNGDLTALLFAKTINVGDYWAIPVLGALHEGTVQRQCIIMTDGTGTAANSIDWGINLNGDQREVRSFYGTLTNFNVTGGSSTIEIGSGVRGPLWLRLGLAASNTFDIDVSIDGTNWYDLGLGQQSKTMTPTHVGIAWTNNGAGSVVGDQYRFGPLVKLT